MAASNESNCNYLSVDNKTLTPRFSVKTTETLNEGIEYLNDHGYAIISDVLSEDEINHNKELLWQFFENIPGCKIRRNDPSTWSSYW